MAGLQGSGKTTTAPSWRAPAEGRQAPGPDRRRRLPPGRHRAACHAGRALGVPMYAPGADATGGHRARRREPSPATRATWSSSTPPAACTSTTSSWRSSCASASCVKPHKILLVVDAMTGQDAVNAAQQFKQRVDIDGVVLTKLDGDARGGAALSCGPSPASRSSSSAPARSSTISRPSTPTAWPRASSAWATSSPSSRRRRTDIAETDAAALEERMRKAEFTFEDFLEQIQQVRKMGSLSSILGMMPGVPGMKELKNAKIDENRWTASRRSLLHDPRGAPAPRLDQRRRRQRIARGTASRWPTSTDCSSSFARCRRC